MIVIHLFIVKIGKEVAKFTKLKYPDLLLSLESFKSGDYATALKESFHRIDDLLEDSQYDALLKELRALPNPSDIAAKKKQEAAAAARAQLAANRASATGSSDALVLSSSGALVTSSSGSSPASQNDIQRLLDDEDENDKDGDEDDDSDDPLSDVEAVRLIRELLLGRKKEKEEKLKKTTATTPDAAASTGQTTPSTMLSDDEDAAFTKSEQNKSASSPPAPVLSTSTALVLVPNKEDQTEEEPTPIAPEKDLEHLHTLPAEIKDAPVKIITPPQPASIVNASGQLICNLKDHRVLAGCTAIVGLVIGNEKLIVANAGDSRGVLCRSGKAIALSEDHKPQDVRESNRIKNAGGFVNAVGRINGNLNLSRSLGDLKYKSLKHLKPEEQIITAEPDIRIFDLHVDSSNNTDKLSIKEGEDAASSLPDGEDEFFVFGCDGIWDVLSNQQAIDFVRTRLLDNERMKTLEEITQDALKHCLADDPRQSQGIGGDNMTFLVVSLKPMSYWMNLREQRAMARNEGVSNGNNSNNSDVVVAAIEEVAKGLQKTCI